MTEKVRNRLSTRHRPPLKQESIAANQCQPLTRIDSENRSSQEQHSHSGDAVSLERCTFTEGSSSLTVDKLSVLLDSLVHILETGSTMNNGPAIAGDNITLREQREDPVNAFNVSGSSSNEENQPQDDDDLGVTVNTATRSR